MLSLSPAGAFDPFAVSVEMMRELFLDDRGLDMTRADQSTAGTGVIGAGVAAGDASDPAGDLGLRSGPPSSGVQGRHVCPFCGSINDSSEGPCPRCTMENTADTRKATKSRIGPWYVLQSRNPAAPGMKFDTLLGFVRKGRVKARSIVRGPTTHQLWRFACQVKGLSREFELCYSCGGTIRREAHVCPQCNRPQGPPADPDVFIEGAQQATVQPGTVQPGTVQPATMPAPVPVAPAPVAPASPSFIPAPAVNVAVPRAESGRPPVYREVNSQSVAVDQDLVVPPLAPAAAGGAAEAPIAQAAALVPPPAQQPPPQPAPRAPAASSRGPTETAGPPVAAQGRRRAEDVFLSAKDLAAAFQLDFKPDPKSGDAEVEYFRSGAAARAAKESDTALPWPPRRRRKRRVGRFVLLLLLVSVGGFAAYLAIDGQFRRQAWDWANAKYLSLTGADLYPDIATRPRATTAPSPAGSTASTAPAVRTPAVSPATPAATQPLSPAPKLTRPLPQTAIGGTREIAPAPDRIGTGTAPPERATLPADTRPVVVSPPRQSPAPTSQAVVPTRPAPAPAPAPPRPQLTLEDAQKRATALYRRAFDAEAKDPPDYAAAKRLYKQIMDELPEEIDGQGVWPGDVKLRYEQTQKMLGEK
jgi:hypothetical protein